MTKKIVPKSASNLDADDALGCSGNSKKQPNKAKSWFFTYNNYTEADIQIIIDKFDSEKTGEFTTGNTEKVDTVEISDPENVENETALAKKTREELAELDDLDI